MILRAGAGMTFSLRAMKRLAQEGNPDDPQKVLARQLRRIRNGERMERLRVPLSEKARKREL